jgi:hypothetical protein
MSALVEIAVAALQPTNMNASNEAEIDTVLKAAANDNVPGGEVNANTHSLPHPLSSSPAATVEHMNNTTPPQTPSSSRKNNRNDALNTTLDRISLVLDVLGDVAELIPVAGIASTLPIVRRIVDQLSVGVLLSPIRLYR